MNEDPKRTRAVRYLARPWWLIVALLILLLVGFGVHALVRGAGEAAGVTEAAPGDDNATPAAETKQHDDY
jgi:F0F1-type ATP synthase assembly protein I